MDVEWRWQVRKTIAFTVVFCLLFFAGEAAFAVTAVLHFAEGQL